MIPDIVANKLNELQSICSEHGIDLICVALDEKDWDFHSVTRSSEITLITAAAIILNGVNQNEGDLMALMKSIQVQSQNSVDEEEPGDVYPLGFDPNGEEEAE